MNGRKVLLVGGGLSGGGGEIHCNMLAKFLYTGSSDVLLVTRPGVTCNRKPTIPIRPESVVTIYEAILRCTKNEYDVILGFGRYSSFIATCLQLLWSPRSALILMDISVFLRAHAHDVRWWRQLPYLGCKVAYGCANLLLANSESSVKGLKTLTGGNVCVKRVPNLIDPEKVFDLCASISNKFANVVNGPYLLTIGRLIESKKIDSAILGFAKIAKRCPHKLLIAGAGPRQDSLEALAWRCKIAERVVFLGWVPNPLPILEKADALIHLSNIEGFPNAILEAMVLRIPVVSGNWGDDARRMADSGSLIMVDTDDADAVGQKILLVLSDQRLRSSLIEKASIEAKVHSIPGAIVHYECLINTVCNSVNRLSKRCQGGEMV